jgi:uncharacterized membrane protein
VSERFSAGAAALDGLEPIVPARQQTSFPANDRIIGIDAARGIAMILVCASHVRAYLVDEAPLLYLVLTSISRVATPTFLLLSGFVAAYVLASNRPHVRVTLIDRGLFVLLVGHFVLNLDDLSHVDATSWIFSRVTITDVIGICLMLAFLAHRLRTGVLVALGVLLAVLSWPIAMTLAPESSLAGYAGAALFAMKSQENSLVDAAIVPYLGLFLIGMALSKRSLTDLRANGSDRVARRLAMYGTAAIVAVVCGILIWLLLKATGIAATDPALVDLIRRGLDPRSKLPPGPAYLLFYGGTGLLVAAACLSSPAVRLAGPALQWTATMGRASLMCFVTQDWLFRLLPMVTGMAHITSITFWLTYLSAGVLMIHWLAARWDAGRRNRLLTIGLKAWSRRHAQMDRGTAAS